MKLFLKYPTLFFSQLAKKTRTISVVNKEELGRVLRTRETNNTQVDGIFLSWGIPGEATGGYYYNSRRDVANGCNRKISNFQQFGTGDNSYSFKISDQKMITYGKSAWNYNDDSSSGFARLVAFDEANIAWLSGIPELKESFRLFASETTNWWDERRNPYEINAPQRLVDVTEFISDKTAKAAYEQLDKLIDEDKLTRNTWELQTHKLAGLLDRPHIYRARLESDPEITNPHSTDWVSEEAPNPTTIRSWKQKEEKSKLGARPDKLGNEPLAVRIVDDFVRQPFDVHFESGTLDSFDVRFHAHYSWIGGNFNTDATVSTRMNQHTRKQQKYVDSVKKKTYLPIITGIVMEICPKQKTGNHHYYEWTEELWSDEMALSVVPEESNPYKTEELLRVKDKTKKRAIKGAYRGGYQGISSLTYNGMTILNYVRESALSAIAKGAPISSYDLDTPKRMPLSLEDFKKIERPKVDIKPIEIGHLRFYRLSVPPKRHITAEILSDLLLPSMPELLIATDAYVRVTQADNYVDGVHCSGECSKNPTVDCELPPGLYLVNRHEKCALGHDPGRTEYTSGFGDISNETITIRRLLSQLKVSYDQFRANMVSNSQTNALHTMSADDNSAFFGRL